MPFDIAEAIEDGRISTDPRMQQFESSRIRKRMDQFGITNETVARIRDDPDVLSSERKLAGAGFNPMDKFSDENSYGDEFFADGGWFSLEELALEKGDKIDVSYDFGQRDEFVITIEDVKQNVPVLPEANLYEQKTRAKLVKKGLSKMRKQYNHGGCPY